MEEGNSDSSHEPQRKTDTPQLLCGHHQIMSKGQSAEEKWKKALGRVVPVLRVCGLFVSLLGAVLFLAMAYSIAFPEHALKLLLGDLKIPLKAVAGSSWAQVAVAFGMHRLVSFVSFPYVYHDSVVVVLPTSMLVWR
jgi:hypothetical protein